MNGRSPEKAFLDRIPKPCKKENKTILKTAA
jgi:hypothetical protein